MALIVIWGLFVVRGNNAAKLKFKQMETIKKVKNTLIKIDKLNNIFLLDGNGIWQQLKNKQIIK